MSAEYNVYVLTTSLEQGWIDQTQHNEIASVVGQKPEVSALAMLHEKGYLTDEHVEILQNAIAEAEGMPAGHTSSQDKAAAESMEEAMHHESSSGTVIDEDYGHVDAFLRLGQERKASDVHLGVGAPPLMRFAGILQPLLDDAPVLTSKQTEVLIRGALTKDQWEKFLRDKVIEFTYDREGLGRFRTSVVRQRRGYDIVFRIIDSEIRDLEDLGVPDTLKELTKYHNGLVLVTGPVGCGKSTTLAAMVDYINKHRQDHIITLEDPIEYVFESKGCQISQREVHTHTDSFGVALRGSLREDPDIIMVGEMRDLETISLAITASETGHLVLGTLHTSTASRTLDRVLDAFPVEQQDQIRVMVAESLRGIVCQQLVPKADGSGRALALEILVNTPAVAALIRDKKTFMLPGIMQVGRKQGMVLMDDSLRKLADNKIITPEEAYDHAINKEQFTDFLN